MHCFSSLLQLAVGTIDGSHGQETWLGEILDVMSHDFGFYEGFLSDWFLFFPFFEDLDRYPALASYLGKHGSHVSTWEIRIVSIGSGTPAFGQSQHGGVP